MSIQVLSSTLIKAFFVSVVLLIIASFVLHALQIPHTHPGHQDTQETSHHQKAPDVLSSLGEYMHAAEKKLYLYIMSVWSLAVVTIWVRYGGWVRFLYRMESLFIGILQQTKKRISSFVFHTVAFFAQGILNPKLF